MKILLICSAGISSNALVIKMQETAKLIGFKAKIWAAPISQLNDFIQDIDIILLSPQTRYLLKDIQKLAQAYNITVDTIHPLHFGKADGHAVIKQILSLPVCRKIAQNTSPLIFPKNTLSSKQKKTF
jgi:PTS system cellobiose-specific IIB component